MTKAPLNKKRRIFIASLVYLVYKNENAMSIVVIII